MSIGNCVGDGNHVMQQCDSIIEHFALCEKVTERPPRDEFHCIEWRAIGPAAGLVHRNDSRMLKPRRDKRFAHEANLMNRTARKQFFDRDVPPEFEVVRT